MAVFEFLLVAAALGSLVAYHVFLIHEVRHSPEKTAIGHANRSRRLWVKSAIDERRDILAVQTLRNWNMAASFLASTAVLLTIGLLSFLLGPGQIPAMLNKLNFFGSTDETLFTFKTLLLVLCFLAAFFNFSLSLRYLNHVAVDIGIPVPSAGEQAPEIVTSLFHRGAAHYTLGMRAYYIAIPVTLWFFGPIWMLVAAIVLIIVLYRLDHMPDIPA